MLSNHLNPNFKKAYIKANEMLVRSSAIHSFPFSARKLVKEQSAIVCRSYKIAQKYGIDISHFGSESAAIFRLGDKSIIFYNETKPKPHIEFSILHEFGHDRLDHNFSSTSENSYHDHEIETNFFTAQLLMPERLIREMQRRGKRINREFLKSSFGVSTQAANKRIETLAKTNSEWHSRAEKEFDDIILNRYSEFLNKICPLTNIYDFEEEYALQQERDKWCW